MKTPRFSPHARERMLDNETDTLVGNALRYMGCLGLVLSVGLLAGCSTPSTRIRHNPVAFSELPPDQQSLVQQGKVAAGFTAAAVRLALGDPDRITIRQTNAAQVETWYYLDFEFADAPDPIFYLGYERGWRGGGFRGSSRYNYAATFPPARVWYVRYRVELQNNRVTGVTVDSR